MGLQRYEKKGDETILSPNYFQFFPNVKMNSGCSVGKFGGSVGKFGCSVGKFGGSTGKFGGSTGKFGGSTGTFSKGVNPIRKLSTTSGKRLSTTSGKRLTYRRTGVPAYH